MEELAWLAQAFEEHRYRLRGVAQRVLGSPDKADDAVQEAWLRLSRADADVIDNLGAWLTTVVGRIALNMLRARTARRTDLTEPFAVEPVVQALDARTPEDEAAADAVGLALLVVLDTLGPDERLAYLLHDVFGVPFDEVAPILDRSPVAARQLASRARRRVRGRLPATGSADDNHREVVAAFLAAARDGDLASLMAVLHPDVVLRAKLGGLGPGTRTTRGAASVARQALGYAQRGVATHPVRVNGLVGAVTVVDGRVLSVGSFVVEAGRIVAVDLLADPERTARLTLPPLG